MENVQNISVLPNATLEQTIATIQRGGAGIALVLNTKHQLVGTITDGDIRRAILRKIPLEETIEKLFADRSITAQQLTVASTETPVAQLLTLMTEKDIRHIPLVDSSGSVCAVALLSELVKEQPALSLVAVIMAGGEGQRLRPLTAELPKPMLPLHDRPLLERTVEQLRLVGIRHITVATHYKAEVIERHFGDGSAFGVAMRYVQEDRPLGTAGALGLMEVPDTPTLVMNGDIVTGLDFRRMLEFHRSQSAVMTVGVRILEINIPYGVIETEDVSVTRLTEKPSHSFIVNAGIYILEPEVYRYTSAGTAIHMTDLVERLLRVGRKVVSFPIQEYWVDVGHFADYQKANDDARDGKV